MDTLLKFIHGLLRGFVIRTNKLPALRELYILAYNLSLDIIVWRFGRFREILSIYLTGSMANNALRPGYSDIDLKVIIKELGLKGEYDFLKNFWKTYHSLRIIFPFLIHVHVLSEQDITPCMLKRDFSRLDIKRSSMKWRLMYGTDVLKVTPHKHFEISVETIYFILISEAYMRLLGTHLGVHRSDEKMENRLKKLLQFGDRHFLGKSTEYNAKDNVELLERSINTLASHYNSYDEKSNNRYMMRFSEYPIEEDNIKDVNEEIKSLLKQLYRLNKDSIHSIILTSRIGSKFSYQIVICLEDGFDTSDIIKILSQLKRCKKNLPKRLLPRTLPIVITKRMLPIIQYNEYCMGQFDYFHLIKHGAIFDGENILKYLDIVNSIGLRERLIISISDRINEMSYHTRNVLGRNSSSDDFLRDYFDYVYGVLPAARLISEKGIVATTPKEILYEYTSNYSDEGYTNYLGKHYEFNKSKIRDAYFFGRHITKKLAEWERQN